MEKMKLEDTLPCLCRENVARGRMTSHVEECKEFQAVYGDLMLLLSSRIRNSTPDQLSVLNNYLSEVKDSISKVIPNIEKLPPDKPQPEKPLLERPPHIPSPERPSPIKPVFEIPREEEKGVLCEHCKKYFIDLKNIFYIDACLHTYCLGCLKLIIIKELPERGDVQCAKCKMSITQIELKFIIGPEAFQKLYDKFWDTYLKAMNIIRCKACGEQFTLIQGSIDIGAKDEKGVALTAKSAEHLSKYRARCPKEGCNKIFCGNCGVEPYHVGYTCEEYKAFLSSRRCRFCKEEIKGEAAKPGALANVCSKEECKVLMDKACPKTLPCGHFCCGYKGESKCLPCLNEGCVAMNPKLTNGQKTDDYCSICFTTGLGDSPSILLQCGHIFHVDCIVSKLKKRWPSPRITFGFSECSQCKKPILAPDHPVIAEETKILSELHKEILTKAVERMKYEGLDKDPRLKDPKFELYGKHDEFAMRTLCFYMCFKCKKPYFGGLKDCRRGMDEGGQEFKEQDLVCGGCSSANIKGGITNCKKHGKDFIDYKCRFCCAVAQWFCFNTTHFCEPCHARQCNGENLPNIPKDKLPACKGLELCPLKIKHPANGEEYSLGCALCREYAVDKKK